MDKNFKNKLISNHRHPVIQLIKKKLKRYLDDSEYLFFNETLQDLPDYRYETIHDFLNKLCVHYLPTYKIVKRNLDVYYKIDFGKQATVQIISMIIAFNIAYKNNNYKEDLKQPTIGFIKQIRPLQAQDNNKKLFFKSIQVLNNNIELFKKPIDDDNRLKSMINLILLKQIYKHVI